jgi:glycosyltransferase involved in cell wall biosynthesis
LHRYWQAELPGCEIVVGRDRHAERRWWRCHPRVFSKTTAINDAFARSHGDVIVILDADAYLPGSKIVHCAARLRAARRAGARLWFVPYRLLFRLTQDATELVIGSDPVAPYRFPTPPPAVDVESVAGSGHLHGHRYGALCQVMPREAFETVQRADPRFCGWGGEDISLLMALDTLWGPHRNLPGQVLHLWHPRHVDPGIAAGTEQSTVLRAWDGQDQSRPNDWLTDQYYAASGKAARMRRLVDEHPKGRA